MAAREESGPWHLLTCEYPPALGGVASYSRAIALELARRGERVEVWTPGPGDYASDGVAVHASPDRWRIRDLHAVGQALDTWPAPRRLFVQWVPHGYGYKSLNVPFACWIALRAVRGDHVDVMVHEPWLALTARSPRQFLGGLVHRLMMLLVLGRCRRAWVSIPAWRDMLTPYARRTEVRWLPVPSHLPVVTDARAVLLARSAIAGDDETSVVGHVGTYGPLVTGLLGPALEMILEHEPRVRILLLGRGSEQYHQSFGRARPDLANRAVAAGALSDRALSLHIQACDLMLQPYADGVSSRRSSAISLLAQGRPIVTTRGRLTEPLWQESGAVELAAPAAVDLSAAAIRLLADSSRREVLRRNARELHDRVYGVERTVDALLQLGPQTAAA